MAIYVESNCGTAPPKTTTGAHPRPQALGFLWDYHDLEISGLLSSLPSHWMSIQSNDRHARERSQRGPSLLVQSSMPRGQGGMVLRYKTCIGAL